MKNILPLNSMLSPESGDHQGSSFSGPSVRTKGVALLACAFALAHGSASAVVVLPLFDFDDAFDHALWTTTLSPVTPTQGRAVSTTPVSVTLTGASDATGRGFSSSIDYTIAAPAAGIFAFSWSYQTTDLDPSYDPSFFLLNGAAAPLSSNTGSSSQGGAFSFPVVLGDIVGFRQDSTDSLGPAGVTTISNIRLVSIPEPGSTLALGFLFCGGAFLRSRRS